MGRSAKVTRTVGLRQMKRASKGIGKPASMAARRRQEKNAKIRDAMEAEADKRREQRSVCACRGYI